MHKPKRSVGDISLIIEDTVTGIHRNTKERQIPGDPLVHSEKKRNKLPYIHLYSVSVVVSM